jgi:uncharacterized membrane protein YdbT with pleckstrin-like domain
MSYIEDSLSKGEKIHQVFQHHWIVKFFLLVHIFLCLTLIWIPVALYYWLTWKFTEQGVTNKRIIYKHGVISRKTDEIRLSAIESIVIKQGIVARILGYGQVIVTGRGAGDLVIKWMTDPMSVKREIENAEHEESSSDLSVS